MRRPVRLFRSHETRRSALVALTALFALAVLAAVVVARVDVLATPAAVRAFVMRFGPAAPVAFVLLQALQVVAAPVPGQVLSFVAGYLFGPYWGTAYSVLGATIGSYVAFGLARRYGRPYVQDLLDESAFEWFDALSHEKGLFALFVVFLVPGLPDDVVCFVAGLSDLDVKRMTLVAALGRTPGYFLGALAGANTARGDYVTAVVIAALLVALSVGVWVFRDRVRVALEA